MSRTALLTVLGVLVIVAGCRAESRSAAHDAAFASGPDRVLATQAKHSGEIIAVAFFPNGKRLVSTSRDEVVIWDIETGRQEGRIQGTAAESFTACAMNPSGTVIVVAGHDPYRTPRDMVRAFDLSSGRLLGTFGVRAATLAFTRDEQLVVGGDAAIPQDWPLKTIVASKCAMSYGAVFDSLGRLIATATWSVDGSHSTLYGVLGEERKHLAGYVSEHYHLSLAPDEQILALGVSGSRRTRGPGSKSGIYLFDVTSGGQRGHIDLTVDVNAVGFSPNGEILAAALGDESVRLWDAATLRDVATVASSQALPKWRPGPLVFSRDGKYLAVGYTGMKDGWTAGEIRLWNVQDVVGGAPSAK